MNKKMTRKSYYKTTSSLFFIIGLAHLMRALYQEPAMIGNIDVPIWFSWVAVILTWYLAWRGFSFAEKLR